MITKNRLIPSLYYLNKEIYINIINVKLTNEYK